MFSNIKALGENLGRAVQISGGIMELVKTKFLKQSNRDNLISSINIQRGRLHTHMYMYTHNKDLHNRVYKGMTHS